MPILGILDRSMGTLAVTKRSAKTTKLFHRQAKAIHGSTDTL